MILGYLALDWSQNTSEVSTFTSSSTMRAIQANSTFNRNMDLCLLPFLSKILAPDSFDQQFKFLRLYLPLPRTSHYTSQPATNSSHATLTRHPLTLAQAIMGGERRELFSM
jgi:hypothetical protein